MDDGGILMISDNKKNNTVLVGSGKEEVKYLSIFFKILNCCPLKEIAVLL
jgi:hypothetical protein